jgi:hypothetical protein
LPAAIAQVTAALGSHGAGVLAGHGKASLPKPAPELVKLAIVPSEPVVTLFVTQNLKFVGSNGAVVCIGRNRRVDLPAPIAELALASNMAVPLADKKRIQTFEGFTGMLEPLEENCQWIGPPGKESPPKFVKTAPPVVHSSFTRYDRGPLITGTMKTTPVEPMAVGQRAMPDEDEQP